MNIWEKIKQDFFGGVATASEKASELIKSGTDTLKLGIEKTSLKTTYASKLAQLNAKERSLNNDMETQFSSMGEILFMLQSENRLVDIEKEAGWQPRKAGKGRTEEIIRTRESLFHPTLQESVDWYAKEGHKEYVGSFLPSYIGVPMISGEDVLGVIPGAR